MFGLRSIALGVTALLFGSALAAPLPQYTPQIGEIVHVAPAHTMGGTVIGAGGHNPHPHITVGYDHQGNALLHPVTHSSHGGLGPSISTNGMGGLTGNVLLNTVAAPTSHIQRGHGRFGGVNVGGQNIAAIQHAQQQTHALIQAHRDAASRHHTAETEHTNAAQSHLAAAQRHAAAGNHGWAQAHQAQALHHQNQAAHHNAQRTAHHNAAGAVTGPDAHALQRAQQSATAAHHSGAGAAASRHHADNSEHHFAAQNAHHAAAQAHDHLAQTYHRMGPQFAQHAAHHAGLAQGHRATAASHAVGSPNAPDPHHSRQQAQQSHATADQTIRQLQHPPQGYHHGGPARRY